MINDSLLMRRGIPRMLFEPHISRLPRFKLRANKQTTLLVVFGPTTLGDQALRLGASDSATGSNAAWQLGILIKNVHKSVQTRAGSMQTYITLGYLRLMHSEGVFLRGTTGTVEVKRLAKYMHDKCTTRRYRRPKVPLVMPLVSLGDAKRKRQGGV